MAVLARFVPLLEARVLRDLLDFLEVATDEPRSEQASSFCSISIFASSKRNLARVSNFSALAFSASALARALASRASAKSTAAFISARF